MACRCSSPRFMRCCALAASKPTTGALRRSLARSESVGCGQSVVAGYSRPALLDLRDSRSLSGVSRLRGATQRAFGRSRRSLAGHGITGAVSEDCASKVVTVGMFDRLKQPSRSRDRHSHTSQTKQGYPVVARNPSGLSQENGRLHAMGIT